MAELSVYDNDPTLYLFTSLTAGSSHIVTATSRIETILKANKIPFKGVDTATDDLARKLYGRRASGKKLPLLVKEGFVIADLEQVEEWNEYDELKEALGVTAAAAPVPSKPTISTTPAPAAAAAPKENTPSATPGQNLAIRQMGAEAAKVAASKKPIPAKISTTNPLLSEKVGSGPSPSILDGMMSPRFVPLPRTPNPPGSTPEPAISYVKSPTPEPQATITETLAKVEAKKVEEKSSEEEDDDEEDEEDEEEVEKKEAKAGDKDEKAKPAEVKKPAEKKTEEKTQDQGAKDSSKAGESVKD